MDFSAPLHDFGPVLQISLIDLLLSGDNAILIAMACRNLPVEVRRKAIFLGTAAAVAFRVLMTFAATAALRLPYLKLVGAVLLLLIAIDLIASDDAQARGSQRAPAQGAGEGVWKAIAVVVAADAVMSLDNVIAIAAAAQDSVWFLIFGLLLSVPILAFSSLYVTRLLDEHPLLVQGGAALLGWIAGKIAVADPAIASTLDTQSFGLVALAPLLGVLYVLLQGRILREQKARHTAPPPAPAATRATAPAGGPEPPRPDAREAPSYASVAAVPMADHAQQGRRLSGMDLTILFGVAVPVLGLVGTLIYIIVKAIGARG